MNRLQVAGILWIVAAGLSIAATLIFRVDSNQIVVTLVAGVVAAVIGVFMLARPSTATIGASNVAGLGWLVLYVVLAVIQSDEIAAWVTDVSLALVGAAAAFQAYRARA